MFKLNKFHPNTQPNLSSLESQKIIKNTIPTPPIHLQPNSKQPNNPQFKKQPLIPQNNESITEKLPEYNKIYSIIPLNIFQTWNTLQIPSHMFTNIHELKMQNSEFKYFLYDDIMCKKFIDEHFEKEVLYSFEKLKTGSYKTSLWKYCILYIKGGIYLDIKYKCADSFKLIKLTDQEYISDDTPFNNINQSIIVSLPYNKLLLKKINTIVEYCKYTIYPNLIQNNNKLQFTDNEIYKNNNKIIVRYDEYKNEKPISCNHMFITRTIYNFPLLNFKKSYNYTRSIQKNILGENIIFYSCTPTIIELDNNYLINIQWVSYYYDKECHLHSVLPYCISLNSRFTIDENFNQISEEIFLDENFKKEITYPEKGLENIKIHKYNSKFYYMASYYDEDRKIISVSSNKYPIMHTMYNLYKTIILPNMYDTQIKIPEKNWSFVNYNNKMCIVYKWFPLQIGEINYTTNKIDITEIKYNIPDYFSDAYGSSSGYIKNDEIWFVLHKIQYADYLNTQIKNCQHFFAVFDLTMNLIRFSETFKLGDCIVECCNGLIVKDKSIILSYSLLDSQCIISEYDIDYIHSQLFWYTE